MSTFLYRFVQWIVYPIFGDGLLALWIDDFRCKYVERKR